MSRFVYIQGLPKGQRFVEVEPDWRPPARTRVAIHGVKPEFKSHADGKYYSDSRSYERELRARGYEVVGSDIKPFVEPKRPKPDGVIEDMRRAAQEISFES